MRTKQSIAMLVLFLLCGWIVSLHGQTAGRIDGTVAAEDGAVPPGTTVVIHKIPNYRTVSINGMPKIQVVGSTIRAPQRVPVLANGAFEAAWLPSGSYQLCADHRMGICTTASGRGSLTRSCHRGRPVSGRTFWFGVARYYACVWTTLRCCCRQWRRLMDSGAPKSES